MAEALGKHLNDKFEKTIVGFLNSKEGGVFYIGVDDDGNSVENSNIDNVQLQAINKIRDGIIPISLGLFDVDIEQVNDIDVVKITVSSGPGKPYYIKSKGMSSNGCFIRVGGATEPMSDNNSRTKNRKKLVNEVALREAVIKAMVHNDYSKLVPPVVGIYSDRIEITSYGGLVAGLSKEDFFSCYSIPRNRELMRIFKDAHLVEQLGSGMRRILKAYDKSVFIFSDIFMKVRFPFNFSLYNEVKTLEKTPEKILKVIKNDNRLTAKEIAEMIGK